MSDDPVERFQESKEQLYRMLEYTDARKELGSEGKKKVDQALKVVVEDIEALIESDGDDSVLDIGNETISKVEQANRLLLDKVTFQGISDWLRDFALKYINFIQQWNDKTIQSGNIQTTGEAIRRIVLGRETMRDAREALSRLLDQVETLQKNQPQALRLSRHYLKQLRDGEE